MAPKFEFEHDNMTSHSVELQEGIEPGRSLLFISLCYSGNPSEADYDVNEKGLLLTPYEDGYIRVGSMWVSLGNEHTGNYKPLWDEKEIREIYLY